MNVLLLNQCFHPDVAATGQYLSDLALGLVEQGHSVTVIAGDRGYDNPAVRFPRRETWSGIRIIRIPSVSIGKQSKWRRALNFGSFLICCAFRLLLLPRFDAVVALTSPPLISLLGSIFVQLKGGRFFFWVMDLNPDEAIAAGWLKETSAIANLLQWMLRYSLRHAEKIIVLDRFMKQRILAKGISERQVIVLPPWTLDEAVHYDEQGREEFRRRYNLSSAFVVLYAGNHSPCHPLDTLLAAAERLTDQSEIVFYFVGGGSEQNKVETFAAEKGLANIVCLPYQPLSELSGLLSAADLHTVVMGDAFVGIVHPCKVYNILAVGKPFLYIGPDESHISDIALENENGVTIYAARHGDVETVTQQILKAATLTSNGQTAGTTTFVEKVSRRSLLPVMMEAIAAVAGAPGVTTTAVSQTPA
jgi:glycosyltransferase involved in cell wall biosynthesis